MERKEKVRINAVRIRIIAARIWGEPDADLSIEVPLEGEIKREISTIPEGKVIKTKFEEHRGCQWSPPPGFSPRSFPAVKKGNLYMLWIEERGGWVGVKYEFRGSHYEGAWQGIDEDIYTSGPFRLNDECAELILRAYNNPPVPIEEVLHTSPTDFDHNPT